MLPSILFQLCSDCVCAQSGSSAQVGKFFLPTLILTINLGLSPPLFSTVTNPFLRLGPPIGSWLWRLCGRSLSATCNLRFFSFLKR
jgi:hypothetical protein